MRLVPVILAGTAAWLLLLSRSAKAASTSTFTAKQYKPYSPEAIALFTAAIEKAKDLPKEWATDSYAHEIMGKESNGWVGKPNYTYGSAILNNRERWPEVWAQLKAGKITTKSSATGLGQCLLDNVKAFYPDGVNGIGDPLNEAIGYLRYIKSRYGSPAVAASVYGRQGDYVHAVTGANRHKSFTEGY